MATKEAKEEGRKLFVKQATVNGRSFRGTFCLMSPGVYSLKVEEMLENTVETEEETTEFQMQKVEALRPYGKGLKAADKKKLQDAIDSYLTENEISIAEALAETTVGKGKNAKQVREIEKALGFEVERYLIEKRLAVKIPIVREGVQISYKDVAEIPHFHRLLPGDVRKSLINFATNFTKKK